MIESGQCVAYELAGFFCVRRQTADPAVELGLRQKVRFLVEDAPSLKVRINTESPIQTYDLGKLYQESRSSQASGMVPLANCGKNLSRVPVTLVEFGEGKGRLILSQLITQGRLLPGHGEAGPCGLRHDPAACQVVWNILARAHLMQR